MCWGRVYPWACVRAWWLGQDEQALGVLTQAAEALSLLQPKLPVPSPPSPPLLPCSPPAASGWGPSWSGIVVSAASALARAHSHRAREEARNKAGQEPEGPWARQGRMGFESQERGQARGRVWGHSNTPRPVSRARVG